MRFHEDKSLERLLRKNPPEPRDELVRSLAARAVAHGAPRSRVRIAFAGALTIGLLAALTSVGGLGYAATEAQKVLNTVKKIVKPAAPHTVLKVAGLTAGGDQYRPGYGWGDPNHNHAGPPGVRVVQHPKLTRLAHGMVEVSASVNIDEQAHLWISVIGPNGDEVVLSQEKSKIGSGVTGPATKVIQYLLLIPRTIPVDLTIVQRLPRGTYKIRIHARDPDGNVTNLLIPFKIWWVPAK